MGTSGWAAKLRTYLDARHDTPTYYYYPLGIHGETTDGLKKRFAQEVEVRRRHDDTSYTFIFAYGANDATWLTDKEQFKATIDDFESNLKEVIEQAKHLDATIYVIDITPVNEKYSAHLVTRNKSCLNKYIDEYNQRLNEVVADTGAQLIAVNRVFKENDLESVLIDDGLHPTQRGHDIIFQEVKSAIEPRLAELSS